MEIKKIFASKNIIKFIYSNALIKPHLLYHGLVMWGSTDPCTTQQLLQLLQNNAVRAIPEISRLEHITPS